MRTRNQYQATGIELAPAAHITISQFDKIDRSVKLVLPVPRLYLLLPGINLNERTWRVQNLRQNEAEELLRALAQRFGGDPAATDSTRMFRLPGFNNKKYEQNFAVRLAAGTMPEPVYHPSDFRIETIPREPGTAGRTKVRAATAVGSESAKTQSERDWAYALRHLRRGDDPDDIVRQIAAYRAADLYDSNNTTKLTSRRKPNPRYYAEHTVSRAMWHLGMARSSVADESRSPETKPDR